MTSRLHRFVGRERELTELREAVRSAERGFGRVCLVTGEPGIGKSRLLEELAQEVAPAVCALWGRCSEAGGAPSYWPWVQVLRALLRRAGTAPVFTRASRAAHLATLVPEIRDLVSSDAPPTATLEPERARFALLDAVVAALSDAAETTPLLLLLEDLHAADPASIALLDLLAGSVRSARIAVIGTMREPEARRSSVAATLARLAREARTAPLPRLDRDEIAAYLTDATGTMPGDALVDQVLAATEGNALFLAQLAPRLAQGGPITIPPGVRAAIRERLSELSLSTRAALEAAAVLGREVSLSHLEALHGGARDAIEEALEAEVVAPGAPGFVRFSHVLLVEELEQSMNEERRVDLHRRAAIELERTGGASASIAHHHLKARETERAIRACARAGEDARARFAFEEAAGWFARAFEETAPADQRSRAELLLAKAGAELAGGDVDRGRATCSEAAAIARRLGATELLARAALVRGSIFVFASVDPALVAALREALDAMPPGDDPLRALVMARLAAALQPSPRPSEPIELAREAIAMARRFGDPHTLLQTMRSAISAMMDLGDPRERAALNREHVRLAQQLGQPAEVLRGTMRLACDSYEIGDLGGAALAIEACERLASVLDDPQARWRACALAAMRANAEGRFEDGARLEEQARGLAARARDPNAVRSLAFLRRGRLRLQGRVDEELETIRELRSLVAPDDLLVLITGAANASALSRAGRVSEARAHVATLDVDRLLDAGDLSVLEPMVDFALAADDRSLADRIRARLEPRRACFASWGMLGLTVGAPVALLLARLAAVRGEHDEARALFEEARERSSGLAPHLAWIAVYEAEAYARAGAHDAARAREEVAVALCQTMGIVSGARSERAASPRVPDGAVRMRREGAVWIVEHGDRVLHLRDGKGPRMLARLTDEPGRELHVLDLSSGADAGDAGELIDARARDQYRARVRALREEIEEATEWNDRGRRERAEEELAAIEAELARALGLGGRSRRAGAAAERARVNVQRRIRAAIDRLGEASPELGRHLSRSIRTGTYCSYDP